MRVIDDQLPEEGADEFLELLVGLRDVAARIGRVATLPSDAGHPPDETTIDFLVGLVYVAEAVERWVETTAAAAAAVVERPATDAGRLFR